MTYIETFPFARPPKLVAVASGQPLIVPGRVPGRIVTEAEACRTFGEKEMDKAVAAARKRAR